VTTPELEDEAVNSAKIEPGAVTQGKLAAGSVDASNVVDHSL
jgi:hypothetical protein